MLDRSGPQPTGVQWVELGATIPLPMARRRKRLGACLWRRMCRTPRRTPGGVNFKLDSGGLGAQAHSGKAWFGAWQEGLETL